jgi:capsular polysaccharide biosynthesis protein
VAKNGAGRPAGRRSPGVELRRYLGVLRRHVALIVVTVCAAGAAAWAATPREATYTAQATIYVGSRQFLLDPETTAFASDRIIAAERLLATFARMIDSRVIATEALERTGLRDRDTREVVDHTVVTPQAGTQLLTVAVTDPSPEVAARLANGLVDAFVASVQRFEPTPTGEGAVPSLPASVFERATPPTDPNPTGAARNVALGLLFGTVAAVGLAFLLEYLDVSIKSPAAAERALGLPVLGVIPVLERAEPPPLRVVPAPEQERRGA